VCRSARCELERRSAVKLMHKFAVVLALVSVFSLASGAEAANFDVSTSLNIKLSTNHIHKGQKVTITGKLKSSQHSCVKTKRINLFANGKQVAHVKTGNNGSYKFVRKPHKTKKFQAKFPGTTTGVHPNQHICEKSKSGIKKVTVG
jgi:hypothetical protein